MSVAQYVGARYVPKFYKGIGGSNDWVQGIAYEPLTIVTFAGNSFTSKKAVPSNIGSPNLNPEYWASTGIYNAQIDEYRQETAEAMSTATSALSAADNAGSLANAAKDTADDAIDSITEYKKENNKRISNLNRSYKGKKIVGHAGASGLAPANTLASFILAAMLKADAIECDVQITSDGVLVCAHNDTVNGYVIRNTESSVILSQPVSGEYASNFNQQTVPTFEDYVKVCRNAGVELFVEIKWEGQHILATELPLVVETLKRYGVVDDTVFISWYKEPLEKLLEYDNTLRIMLLLGDQYDVSSAQITYCAQNGYYGVGIPRMSNVSFVTEAQGYGLKTNAFTLEKGDTNANAFVRTGCDYLTTGHIIDIGAVNNPYTSGGVFKTASVYSKNGQAVISKFFAESGDNFPTMNTTTSRFASSPSEIKFPARISEMSNTYGMVVKNVSPGQKVILNIISGYRSHVTFYGSDGAFISTTNWNSTAGAEEITVPANAYVAVVEHQKGDGTVALDYWDLVALSYVASVK